MVSFRSSFFRGPHTARGVDEDPAKEAAGGCYLARMVDISQNDGEGRLWIEQRRKPGSQEHMVTIRMGGRCMWYRLTL